MTTLTEGTHPGAFVVSEANGSRSRATVTVAKSAALNAGTVVGQYTSGANEGKYALHDAGQSDGRQTAAAVLYGNVDASSADVKAVAIVRDAEVVDRALTFKTGITTANRTAALEALSANGVIAR